MEGTDTRDYGTRRGFSQWDTGQGGKVHVTIA